MNAHEAVTRTLVAAGVDTVFALMAEDTMNMIAAIEEHWTDDISVVEARHEQNAMAMADGYARARDEVGVCVVGRGPGIAQTGTTLVTARKAGSKLLAIVPEMARDADYDPKEFKQEAYLESTIEEVITSRSAETVLPSLREGLRTARNGDGPVAVQIAWDVLDGDLDVAPEDVEAETPARPAARPRVEPDPEAIDAALDAYLESDATRAPVILAGLGAVYADARGPIEVLAERTNAMLATTLQARGFLDDHPFHLGFAGEWGHALTNEYLTEADCIFAVGASLNPHTTDHGYLVRDEAKVIQIDTDAAAFERHTPVDVAVEGDARATVEALDRELEAQGIDREGEFWTDRARDRIAETPALDEGDFPEDPDRLDPRDLVRTVDRLVPDDRLVVTDGGHFTRWVVDGISRPTPRDFVWTLDFAAIGQGLSAGIGAAVSDAHRDRPCVTFCGDAGFMMAIQEVETAARNDVPITVVVMNDGALGSEYHNLAPAGGFSEAALIEPPEFAAVADAFGAEGHTARSVEDLEALAPVFDREADGPVVVDCKVNHEVRHRSKG